MPGPDSLPGGTWGGEARLPPCACRIDRNLAESKATLTPAAATAGKVNAPIRARIKGDAMMYPGQATHAIYSCICNRKR